VEFDKDKTEILYFKPQNQPYEWGERKLFAWPCYVYKVLAPQPRPRKINILQKAVLGLIKIGFLSTKKVADYIGIEIDLTAKIFEELLNSEYIDENHYITKKGNDVLNGEINDRGEMISAYIFQDAFTGEFWDRFIIDFKDNIKKIVDKKLNISNNNKKSIHFIEIFKNIDVNPPNMDEVSRITKNHKKLNSKLNSSSFSEYKHDKIYDLYKNISLINEKPIGAYWLTAWIYFPKEISNGKSWNVYDPFGLENDFKFRKIITKVSKSDYGLNKFISGFIKEEVSDSTENIVNLLKRQNKDLSNQIIMQFGDNILKYEDLFNLLMKLKLNEVSLEIQGRNIEKNTLNSLSNNIHLVIELLFSEISEQFPTKDSFKNIGLVKNDKLGNRECIKIFLQNLIGNNENIISKYINIPFGQLKSVANYNSGKIKARLLISLFTVKNNPDHPLFNIVKKEPNILEIFFEIEELRNASQHGGKDKKRRDRTNILLENYKKYIGFTYNLISILLKNLENNKVKIKVDFKLQKELNKASSMIETEANIDVKNEFGDNIVDYEKYYSEISKLFYSYSKYVKSDYNKYEVNKVATSFTKVFESIFEIINESFIIDDFRKFKFSKNDDLNSIIFSELAKKLGFNVKEKGLLKSLTHININKIKNNSTLNAKVLYSLMVASYNEKHPLIEFAKKFPDFFEFIVELQQDIRQEITHASKNKKEFTSDYIKKIYIKTKNMNKFLFNNLRGE